MTKTLPILAVMSVLSGVADAHTVKPAPTPIAEAAFHDATGADRGFARLAGTDGSLILSVTVVGLTPGPHGMHVHAVGRCEGPAFASAGAHLNPDMHQHGHANPLGPHEGDLPEIIVGPDGRGTVSTAVAASLAAVLDEDGSAIVVHANGDDEKTDPSGNSGARLICAALARGA